MSYLQYSYLGCYRKKGSRSILDPSPKQGTKNQQTCFQSAKNKNYFALQSNQSGNCYVGNNNPDETGVMVDDENCVQPCNDDILLSDLMPDSFQKRPGCGSIQKDENMFFSLYKINKSLHPKSIKENKNQIFIDNSPAGQSYKNGPFKFKASSYAWNWSAKNAFDGSEFTYWHTPYLWGGPSRRNYNRDKDQAGSSYCGTNEQFRAVYRDGTSCPAVKHYRDPSKAIIYTTQEKKTDPNNILFNPPIHKGEWIQVEFPYKIQPSSFDIRGPNGLRKINDFMKTPKTYTLLATNGDGWTKLGDYTNNEQALALQRLITPTLNKAPGYDNIRDIPFSNEIILSDTAPETSFSTFRLVVKETNGSINCSIGDLVIKGRICVDMNGNCNEFRISQISAGLSGDPQELDSVLANNIGTNSALNDIYSSSEPGLESFRNELNDHDDNVIHESFIDKEVKSEFTNPINESGVFKVGYSKF